MKKKSPFQVWLKREYNQWCKSQESEEDFLVFCSLFGYEPVTVIGWINGETIPQGAEVLCIAGVLGAEVYQVLGLPEPDPELLKIFNSLSNLTGELRSKLAHVLWEVGEVLKERMILASSEEGKELLRSILGKWGIIGPIDISIQDI